MVYSMSGFGRSSEFVLDEKTLKEKGVTIEIRSVNSKTCDISVKTSSRFLFLEELVKNRVRDRMFRGKFDISIYISIPSDTVLGVDFDTLDQFHFLLKKIEKRYRLRRTRSAGEYIGVDGALSYRRSEIDAESIKMMVFPVLEKALDELSNMRRLEGEHLQRDLLLKLADLETCLEKVESRRPQLVKSKYEVMKSRIEELIGGQVDDRLLLQDAALFAERIDIEEEIVRLRTHITHMRTLFQDENPIGRKLDFISQELLREVNTVGSKSPDEEVSVLVIEMKSLIDRVKEQVQNIL